MTAHSKSKIAFRSLFKSFRREADELAVLESISLEVMKGEFVCILGPSGCGKSTLLNITAGFDSATSGSVEIDGEIVRGPDPRRTFVFQEYAIFPWATVDENIALGLHDKPRAERDKLVAHWVERVGLAGFERSFPAALSGGMKQRVAVARALAVSPDIVFMDEPFGALDSLTRLQMRAELSRLWSRESMTVLFVTHDVDEAIQLADRIVVLTARPGRIREIVTVDMAHPRDLGTGEYGRMKRHLFELLGVAHAV